MNLWTLIICAGGVFVFLKIFAYLSIIKYLLDLRFRDGDCRLCDISEMPLYSKDVADAYSEKIEELEFKYSHCQISKTIVESPYTKIFHAVYFNHSIMCYANISIPFMPGRNFPPRISFASHFSDGHVLLTVNGVAHDIIGKTPEVTLIDPYSESLTGQLQAHLEGLSKLKKARKLVELSPNEFVERDKISDINYFENLKREGIIERADDNYYKMKFTAAVAHLFKYLKGSKKLRQLKLYRELPDIDIPIEAECDAFFQMQDILASKKKGYSGKILVFVISLLAFVLAFKISFSFYAIFIILITLMIHELGHFVAMKMFKYKDVQIFFLPFIGAATMGSDRKATALQRVVVYLMGPVPGIIIGTICILLNRIFESDMLMRFGLFMLLLNYLNLLPIVPFDGGRIFDLVIFSRWHFMKSLFLILSVAALGGAGLFFGDSILIALAVFLGFAVPSQIRENRNLSVLRNKIKVENIELEDRAVVREILLIFKERPNAKLTLMQKFKNVKKYLDDLTAERPSTSTIWLSLVMYFVAWMLPISIIISTVVIARFWNG